MAIDPKEIEKIVDDFEAKARQYHDISEGLYMQGKFLECVMEDEKSHAFEYCAMVLRRKVLK
ncbi:hypothetical protein [Fictibacillus gelatini]|uniref:hypothetical protein n=1 Tax=Fictibacillus gelatini TaxID=225985 RepID=UPI00042422CC|nr:hypothetical protein [Fictibacillus gelatini]